MHVHVNRRIEQARSSGAVNSGNIILNDTAGRRSGSGSRQEWVGGVWHVLIRVWKQPY